MGTHAILSTMQKKIGVKPLLLVDFLGSDFGKKTPEEKIIKKRKPELSEVEENLLNLIANVIIDIIVKEEL